MDDAAIVALLTEIRDLQKTALENQRASMATQNEYLSAFHRARRTQLGALAILFSVLGLFLTFALHHF